MAAYRGSTKKVPLTVQMGGDEGEGGRLRATCDDALQPLAQNKNEPRKREAVNAHLG